MANKPKPKSSQKQKQNVHHGQTHRSQKKPVRKERGFWLTLALVLMVVTGLVAAYFYNAAKDPSVERVWILSAMVIANLLDVAAAVGIWFWKKWGLYVYAVASILALVAGLVSVGMLASFYLVMPVAIVGWLLRTKWSYFE